LIVDYFFHERLADALGHAAMNLTLDDHGINDHAAVIGAVKIAKLYEPSIQVDDHDGEMHSFRVIRVRRIVELGCLKPRPEAPR
jgi:hypothetical protein